nr:phosphoenolpyruvate--protein phosphotransferase [Kallotenue papyrolyticum]
MELDQRLIRIGAHPSSKAAAIQQVGELLVAGGYIAPAYIASMLRREEVANTYLGNGIAIPHGLPDDRNLVLRTGIAVLQVPQGVVWQDHERAQLIVGIAARSDEHIEVLRRLTRILGDRALVARLTQTNDPQVIAAALSGTPTPTISPTPSGDEQAPGITVTISHPTGLHARPAGTLAELARRFQAAIRIHYGSRSADAKSLIELLQLGVEHGAQVRISASGPDAEAALAALRDAISSGLGEEEPLVLAGNGAPPAHGWQPRHSTTTIHGISAAPGLALGPTYRHRARRVEVSDQGGDPLSESERLQAALNAAAAELEQLYAETKTRLGSSKAAIFLAHREFLNDSGLLQEVARAIFAGHSAAWAWHQAIQSRVSQLQKLDDPVLAGRAVDLSDVGQRVLRHLVGAAYDPGPTPATPVILLAEDLTPSDTAMLDPDTILGLCTARGGPTSHTAIIARSLGIPAMVGAGASLLDLPDGTPVVLDGDSGALYVAPAASDLEAARQWQARLRQQQAAASATRHAPAVTLDGVHIEVAANVNRPADAVAALEAGAEAIGLLRTEFLFLERSQPPSEDEQFAVYRDVVQAMQGRPVIIRTLDIGGDKSVAYLDLPHEDNTFLGIRGIRLCLQRPELFIPQLRAIYRAAAYGPVRIMFPMIATLEEWHTARALAEQVRTQLEAPRVELGIMVEVPSAALLADHFATEVDFFSIGTNDLTQYTLAMDRLHPELARQADALHPAVLRLMARTVEAARAHSRWVSVCGGVAGDPRGALILAGLGVRELSVSPPAIAEVKAALRAQRMDELQALAQRALTCRSAAEVRRL